MTQMVDGKKLLSDAKFYEGYSRYDETLGRYETWDEAVERVMNMHRQKYADKMTPALSEAIDFAEQAYKDQLVLGSQRALQFGGDQIFKHSSKLYNCLGKETRFVTSVGMRSFMDFRDGDTTEVLTHKGNWKRAIVRCYGRQPLNSVVLHKSNTQRTIRATPNHRWILSDGSETTELKTGDRLLKEPKVFNGFDFDNASLDEERSWASGCVYGDGTLNNGYSLVRLCSNKRRFEHRFTSLGFGTSSSLSLAGDIIVYTGSYQKELPVAEMTHPDLMRAFIAGYLDADGEVNRAPYGKKFISIQASGEESINFIDRCFPIAGVHITSTKDLTGTATNYGSRGLTVKFTTCDSSGSKYNAGWKVDQIAPNSVMEDVWCLEVEDDHSFILEGGIVTGNCAFTHCSRPRFFQETMYLLLSGCGVGFSVQEQHIAKLPAFGKPSDQDAEIFTVPDSIEGWADAFGVLLSSYLTSDAPFPEYSGKYIHFDYSKIRPRNAYISGGFKAPGPDGLTRSIEKCRRLLDSAVENGTRNILPIEAYDFVMHMSDAVLSGGVRRSATICIFSPSDQAMIKAKTGNWFIDNPQRGRSNNSVALLRNDTPRELWDEIMSSVRDCGEPGFIFLDDLDQGANPCVEIGMLPILKETTGETGFQFCNL